MGQVGQSWDDARLLVHGSGLGPPSPFYKPQGSLIPNLPPPPPSLEAVWVSVLSHQQWCDWQCHPETPARCPEVASPLLSAVDSYRSMNTLGHCRGCRTQFWAQEHIEKTVQ